MKIKKSSIFAVGAVVILVVAGTMIYRLNNAQPETPKVTTMQKNGIVYQTGTEVDNAKFSLGYPKGWQVSIQDDQSSPAKRLTIYIIPPGVVLSQGQNFWGGFYVAVYPPQSSIENWLSDLHRDYYSYTTSQIGNKTAYLIRSSSTAPQPMKDGFVPRYIILGKYYAYQIDFFRNGEQGFAERIRNEVFPGLNFQ